MEIGKNRFPQVTPKRRPNLKLPDPDSNLLNSILQGQEKTMKDGKKKIKTEVPVHRPENPKEYHPILI